MALRRPHDRGGCGRVTVYRNSYRCWEVEVDADGYVEHFQSAAEAFVVAREVARGRTDAPPARHLPEACAGVACDECGGDYEDVDTGNTVHVSSTVTALDRIDAAGWTTDPDGTVVHCPDCPDLGDRPPIAYRTPGAVDVPLPGMEVAL